MDPNQCARARQRLVRQQAGRSDAHVVFNLLAGPTLFDQVESMLPAHRERLPTRRCV
jgi:hypothetical protein